VKIPIRNIYYLLLYAWDVLPEREDALVAGLPTTDLAELFGQVLHGAIVRIHRRGMHRSYAQTTERLAGLRGQIELTPTLTNDLLRRGQTVCTYDERHGARRLRSAHLYQLYAYLQNTRCDAEPVDGILLYAQVGQAEDSEVVIQDHRVRVTTLDLSAEWEQIHRQLLDLNIWAISRPVMTDESQR
jgi:5-methylcytosine-specific restriction endonuclease McrBC regulatory subunit McrC